MAGYTAQRAHQHPWLQGSANRGMLADSLPAGAASVLGWAGAEGQETERASLPPLRPKVASPAHCEPS